VCCLMWMLRASRSIMDWISGCGTGCCMHTFNSRPSSSLDPTGIVLSSRLWKARFEGYLPVTMLVSMVVSAFILFCQMGCFGSAWNPYMLSYSSWMYFTAKFRLFSDSFASLFIYLFFFSFLSLLLPRCAARRDGRVVIVGMGVDVARLGSSGIHSLFKTQSTTSRNAKYTLGVDTRNIFSESRCYHPAIIIKQISTLTSPGNSPP
jgi:hypothetical protein